MNRTLLSAIPFLLAANSFAAPAEQGQLDASESLFTVLAAINAAGYDADLASSANHPIRAEIRKILASRQLASVEDLRKFFDAHRQKDPGAELSQYISFGLCIGPPPAFKYRYPPAELPPDVVPLAGLDELLAAFYKEAGIADLWARSQPAIDRLIEAYQPGVLQGVTQVNAYLRNPTSGYLGRRFQVYLDILGAPNQVHTRSYRDDYFIVLTPSLEPQTDDIRHAYLHYLTDPLVARNAEPLTKLRPLFDYAQGAPALDQIYKDDFFLLSTECFIKALEARLTPGAARKQALLDQAAQEGFILTPAFFDALTAYEKQDQAMRFHFKELAQSLDLRAEVRRLEKVKFASTRAVKQVKTAPPAAPPEPTGVLKALAGAQELYTSRKLDEARQAYLKVLQGADEQSAHAKAYYGLARIAALQRDGELAERMFQKALESRPDGETQAWSLVYLGRLADARGERDQALQQYKAALEVKDATPGARQAAEQGIKQSFGTTK